MKLFDSQFIKIVNNSGGNMEDRKRQWTVKFYIERFIYGYR